MKTISKTVLIPFLFLSLLFISCGQNSSNDNAGASGTGNSYVSIKVDSLDLKYDLSAKGEALDSKGVGQL